MSNLNRTITYGKEKIEFSLEYCDRKTLDIAVHPDQQVFVKAPTGAAPDCIDQKVRDKIRWILKQKSYFNQFQPQTPQRLYVSGETHLYLGRQYRLKVQTAQQENVRLRGRYIQVSILQQEDASRVSQLLETWYLRHARVKFRERLDCCFQSPVFHDCPHPTLTIRRLTRRWGSLTKAGRLILNRDLIRAPLYGLDYVITHELCHLIEPNHSNAFFRLLATIIPDWEARKDKMEKLLI